MGAPYEPEAPASVSQHITMKLTRSRFELVKPGRTPYKLEPPASMSQHITTKLTRSRFGLVRLLRLTAASILIPTRTRSTLNIHAALFNMV